MQIRTADDEIRKARDALCAATARSRDKDRNRLIESIIEQLDNLLKK